MPTKPSDPSDFLARWRAHFAPWVARAREEVVHFEATVATDLAKGEPWRALGTPVHLIISRGRLLGYQSAATGEPPDTDLVRRIVHEGMWGWACLRGRMLQQRADDPFGACSYESPLLWLMCLTRVCEMEDAFRWLSRYVYNSFVAGGMDGGGMSDVEFNNLFWLVSKSIDDGRWHAQGKPEEPLGVYEALAGAVDAAGMADAAAQVCEHIARSRLTSARDARGEHFIYEQDPWGALPLDLLAVARIRESITGERLPLGEKHPLLLPCFTSFPNLSGFDWRAPLEPYTRTARRLFGADWEPWAALP